MIEIGSFEARTHFSDLLRRVERGDEFLVTMRGRPVARLLQAEITNERQQLGQLLSKLEAFRAEIGESGSLLNSGETFKDWGREGLKW